MFSRGFCHNFALVRVVQVRIVLCGLGSDRSVTCTCNEAEMLNKPCNGLLEGLGHCYRSMLLYVMFSSALLETAVDKRHVECIV